MTSATGTGSNSSALPATGRTVSFPVIGLIRLTDGKLAEGWFEFDTGAITEQLTAPASTATT